MKFVLVVLAVALLAWMLFGRSRRVDRKPPPESATREPQGDTMVACAHCGVHLPSAEALTDAAGRRYCGDAHRAAGPR